MSNSNDDYDWYDEFEEEDTKPRHKPRPKNSDVEGRRVRTGKKRRTGRKRYDDWQEGA